MAPAAFRRHLERGGESSPPSSSYLNSPLDGRRVSPLVLGLNGGGGARAPPRLDLSLCFLLFLHFPILAFHRFLYSRRSVTPIGLKFWGDFYPDISFLVAEGNPQPTYRGPTSLPGMPWVGGRALWACGPLGHRLTLILFPKIHIYSKINPHNFLLHLDFVWYGFSTKQKTCKNRN